MELNLGLSANATGTTDVITATYVPAPTLIDKKILFLKTTTPNITTSPTFAPNGLADKTVKRFDGQSLQPGDMAGNVILMFNSSEDAWMLLNPRQPNLEDTQNKGVAYGYASLDGAGKVPTAQLNGLIATTDDITVEGSTNKWFTAARAIASVLTGFVVSSTRSVISATDTISEAFGKVQKHLNDLAPQRETMVDANKTFTAGKNQVYTTVVLTAPRVLNLPLANTLQPGDKLIFIDEIGGISLTNYVTPTASGSDTINGSATQILNARYGVYEFTSDGVDSYTLLNITPTSVGTWTPTAVGISSMATAALRWSLTGDQCTINGIITGTAVGTTLTFTGPFNAIASGEQRAICPITNNTSTNAAGLLTTGLGTNIITCYTSPTAGAWSSTGTKWVYPQFTYTIA